VVASFVNGMRVISTLHLDGKVSPLLSRSLKEDDLYVIFSKARVSQAFVDTFSEALRQFKQTPAFQAIYRKYFPPSPYDRVP
jgi:polar amino acid transport system substrate-binding protein